MCATQHTIRNGAGGAGGRGGIAHDPDRQQEAEHAKAYVQAAGNHPCACGSSKKYKLCCATAEEKALKALQERRLVLVSIQNGSTASNDAAMKGVHDFKADPNYGPSTELVAIDPADPAEAGFLKLLQVAPQTKEAVTVCLRPPGQAIARFSGGTDKDMIVAAVSAGGGCGPNGCGPGGCGE